MFYRAELTGPLLVRPLPPKPFRGLHPLITLGAQISRIGALAS